MAETPADRADVPRTALIGSTGFVGGALARRRRFDCAYNSRSIDGIAGESFDLVVCAGAPAAMWAANARPELDAANLDRLFAALALARIGRLVLISTIAVFDDASAGYTESTARYEGGRAYGQNRRTLELKATAAFDCHVLRLPALFGRGLKKNFIFDLMNPVPSFIRPAKFDELKGALPARERDLLERLFAFDAALEAWRFDRESVRRGSPEGAALEEAFRRLDFLARNFTNSESRYQFYNIDRLARDIDRCLDAGIRVLNVCSTPLRAADIHRALLGQSFSNAAAPRVEEDVRSEFAAAFGGKGPYLYSADQVLAELGSFVEEEMAAPCA